MSGMMVKSKLANCGLAILTPYLWVVHGLNRFFFKSLYVWDMAPCSYFRLKSALKWKIECQAAIFTVCNPDQSSYTISWTHIRCFWGTNKLFDFFRFPAINCNLSKNLVFVNIAKTEACFTRFLKCRRFFPTLIIYIKSYHGSQSVHISKLAPKPLLFMVVEIENFEKSLFWNLFFWNPSQMVV